MAGVIGSIFTMDSMPGWYATIEKPDITPPGWLFAPVWISLYAIMGISAYLIFKKGMEKPDVRTALGIFGIQLMLNTLWSMVFFGMNSILGAMLVIILLWISIIATIKLFYKISKTAGFLLVPYILWVSFATILNYLIFTLN